MCSKCGGKSLGVWCAFCTENMRRKEKGLTPKLRGVALAKHKREMRKARKDGSQ